MAIRRKAHKSEDGGTGAPEWMLTYSDCMTLLLTFFVMLISFSSFDEKVYRRVESAFMERLASIGVQPIRDNRALAPKPQIVYEQELAKGSEQPTITGRYESNPSQSLDFLDLQNQKVFLLPSDRVFWGRGTRLSSHGVQLLADIAALLKATGGRIIVSEHGLEGGDDTTPLGLRRAWYVMELLAGRPGLDKTRFSISSASTVTREAIMQSAILASPSSIERIVEIAVLERSIYH